MLKCGGLSHLAASKLCPDKTGTTATARKVEEAEDLDGSDESSVRIVECRSVLVGKLEGTKKNNQSIFFVN